MATSGEIQKASIESEINLANLANADLLCQLCKIFTVQMGSNPSDDSRVCQKCSQENSFPTATEVVVDSISQQEKTKLRTEDDVDVENQVPVDRGFQRELNIMTETKCPVCSWNGFNREYEEHMRNNHGGIQCSDCQASFSTINSYNTHRQNACKPQCVPCPLRGCDKMVKQNEIKAHYLSVKHQQILAECVIDCVNMYKQRPERFNNSTSTSGSAEGAVQKVLYTEAYADIRSPGSINYSNDSKQLGVKCTDMGTMDQSIISNSNIAQLVGKDNSIFFRFNLPDQIINSSFSFDSPSFRTDTFGYVFTIRVCSTLQSNHLSIYLTLHRSPFDPILTYPFPYNMTISLCDQSGQEAYIKAMIRADPASPAFARPNGERNPEVGVMNFCPLHSLTENGSNYLKDGVFFIRLLFHFMDTATNTNK